MAVNLRRSHGPQIAFLSVLLGCIVLTASAVAASNQETTAEPSMVTFTFEGEFMFLAQMEFEVFDSNQNSVLRVNQDENTDDHQLVLAPGQYNIEARANAGPFSIGMESLEFDSQEYSHVTFTVQYVLVTEIVSVLVLVLLTLSLLRVSRRSFGRLRRKRSTSISSNAHVEPTDDMLAEQDPKSDSDLEDALKEHRESFSEGLDTRGDFLPPPRGGPISLYDVIDYYAPQDKPIDIDIPFWPPDDADSTGKDLWYQFKETESGTTVVELVSEADYDTRIPVYKLPYEERKRAEEESLPEQDPKSDGVRIHLGPPPPEEEKVLRERKSAEEESLPEQEPVDDPYYPGAPGDRELAIKYGLEWIKTPEEEKVLRELWEKENERRKKRGSILISWLVWKEMFKQEQKDIACDPEDICEGSEQEQGSGTRAILPEDDSACDPEDSCEGSEQEQGSGTRAILPEDVLTPGVDDGILEHSDTGSGPRAILPTNIETPPEAPPSSNQDDFPPPAQDEFLTQEDENFCFYHADGCDAEKLREHVKKFIEEHDPERLDEVEKFLGYHRGWRNNLSDEQLFQLLCESFGVDKEKYDNPYKGAEAEEEARRANERYVSGDEQRQYRTTPTHRPKQQTICPNAPPNRLIYIDFYLLSKLGLAICLRATGRTTRTSNIIKLKL